MKTWLKYVGLTIAMLLGMILVFSPPVIIVMTWGSSNPWACGIALVIWLGVAVGSLMTMSDWMNRR